MNPLDGLHIRANPVQCLILDTIQGIVDVTASFSKRVSSRIEKGPILEYSSIVLVIVPCLGRLAQ